MALYDEVRELQSPPMPLEALICEEQGFDEEEEEAGESESLKTWSFQPLDLLEVDMFWDDSELASLIAKEERIGGSVSPARREAADCIIGVGSRYGFAALTAVLAVNYFDRFASSCRFQQDSPWMGQLAAVACLSLAAKVEETHVPLLLDLQVEGSRFLFEAKTIQKMELLVLSTLKWRMNPVTPISFFSHIVRRLGLKNHMHWEFLWKCERLLLSLLPDSRFVHFRPSVLATATMLHVINEMEPFNFAGCQEQLLGVLRIDEDSLNECYNLMDETSSSGGHGSTQRKPLKRKQASVPGSPSGVIDASFGSDTSNDSWTVLSSEPRFKRSRAQDQQMRLPTIKRVSLDVLSSPR